MTASPSFNRGAEASQAAAEAAASGGKFAKVHFLSMEDGDREFLRPLNSAIEGPDGWISVKQHMGVPTVNAPADYKGNWPKSMPAVCRNDDAFQGLYPSCYIDDNLANLTDSWGKPVKAKPRNWMLAVRRVEILGDGSDALGGPEMKGKRVGLTDALREVKLRDAEGKETGQTGTEIDIVVINQAYSTFFEPLHVVSRDIEGDIRDYDFSVRRKGAGTDTSYVFLPQMPQTKLRPGSDGWARYEQALQDQNLDLAQVVASRASDEYYGRFFDPSLAKAAEESSAEAKDAAPAAQQAAAPSNDADDEAREAMRNRLRGYDAASAESPALVSAGVAALDD